MTRPLTTNSDAAAQKQRVLVLASLAQSLRNFRGPLIEALRANGHEVHACAPELSADSVTRDWLTARGVLVHDAHFSRAGLNPLRDLSALLHLWRLMRALRPDVFLGYTIKPVVWGLLAARLAGIRQRVALITGLGYAFTGEARGKRALIQRIARELYALALRGAHLVFFQNPDDKADFAQLGLLPPDLRVEIVNGSGVDLALFPETALPAEPLRFLLIARLLGDKGIREYVAAARDVRSRWPEAEFHIVGGLDPNPDGIPAAEAEAWGRDGSVHWHGALDDVRPAIAACHVYVLPSYREGTPRTVLEAMSMGRAIITTDAPGCRETVLEGENGLRVPPRDSAALAAAMERFLRDPSLCARMGRRSRAMAEDRYDVAKVCAAMIAAMAL